MADQEEREAIYRICQDIYAIELKQYNVNQQPKLLNDLDKYIIYIIAKKNRTVIDFVSIIMLSGKKYSMDKYLQRDKSPFIYEIGLLAVIKEYRDLKIALAFMYASVKWIKNRQSKKSYDFRK